MQPLRGLRALRLLPTTVTFRPHNPIFRHPLTHRPLATVSHTTVPARAVDNSSRKNPCADFYRTKIDIDPFSCDWDDNQAQTFFSVPGPWYNLTKMEFYAKRLMKVRGTIRPLAFLPGWEPAIAFETGGEYYFLDLCIGQLVRFGGNLTSEDEFLDSFIHNPGLECEVEQFPENTDDLYAATCKEQGKLLDFLYG